MNDLMQELIGFAAGTIVTSAALPRLRDIMRNHDVALGESLARNALIAGGNFIWVIYGVLQNAHAVTVMCGLSTVLNGMILVSIGLARRRHARMMA
jgi:uncharacterized protein with PQ loop repeat